MYIYKKVRYFLYSIHNNVFILYLWPIIVQLPHQRKHLAVDSGEHVTTQHNSTWYKKLKVQ